MLLTGEAFFSADLFTDFEKIIVFHSRCSPRGDQAAVAAAELGENPHSMKLYNPNWSGELLKPIWFKLKDAAPLHEQRHPANFFFRHHPWTVGAAALAHSGGFRLPMVGRAVTEPGDEEDP